VSVLKLLAKLFLRKAAAPQIIRRCPAHAPPAQPAPPVPEPEQPAQLELDTGYWWAPRDMPLAPPPLAPDPLDPREGQIAAALQRILDGGDVDLPVLPVVAHRALSTLRSENVDYAELAQLIGEDPAISARVLRVVNSTAYARLFRIDRLEVAFARLGCTALRGIILATSLKGVAIRTGGAQRTLGEELWQRAIVSAVLLSELSGRFALRDGEAFLVGLLHDLGNFAILRVLHDQRFGGGNISRAAFDRLSHQWHEPLGAYLARAWQLGEPLPDVIGDHHSDSTPDDSFATYRWLVQFSEVVCSLLGYSTCIPCDFFALSCVQNLRIQDTPETRQWLLALPTLIIERTGVF
jgi:HD-like signal output (HDOD) protein